MNRAQTRHVRLEVAAAWCTVERSLGTSTLPESKVGQVQQGVAVKPSRRTHGEKAASALSMSWQDPTKLSVSRDREALVLAGVGVGGRVGGWGGSCQVGQVQHGVAVKPGRRLKVERFPGTVKLWFLPVSGSYQTPWTRSAPAPPMPTPETMSLAPGV